MKPKYQRSNAYHLWMLLLAMLCSVLLIHTQAAAFVRTKTLPQASAGESASGNTTPSGNETELPSGLVKQGKNYVLYVNGVQAAKTGWLELSKEKFFINREKNVTARMDQSENTWKFYKYNSQTESWEVQKELWASVSEKEYYFNTRGICTKIYSPDNGKCQKYSNGKMAPVKKELCTLPSGKLYFFNARGVRITDAGWQKLSGTQYIQTGKNGSVISKMEKTNKSWRYFKYRSASGDWRKQKKLWLTFDKKKYHFNTSGACTKIYNTVSQKCYDYKNGKKTLVKNAVRTISGIKCYFGPKGAKINSAGLYLSASGKLIYAKSNGHVAKEISGKVEEYTLSRGKITACKIRTSHTISYYNGKGILTRTIDLNKRMVALTYDDGPSQYTPIILDLLKKHKSAATFFVVGNRVSSYPDAVKRTYEMGCEIGNHTYSHSILTSIDVSSIQSQISATNSAVKSVTGASPVVMRPPGGGYNGTVQNAVGMPLIMWSIDTLDWKTRNAAATQSAVLDSVKDGDVVLMHDLHGPTAEASKVIIPELVRRGYQLVTVSELAQCRGGISKGVVYNSFR